MCKFPSELLAINPEHNICVGKTNEPGGYVAIELNEKHNLFNNDATLNPNNKIIIDVHNENADIKNYLLLTPFLEKYSHPVELNFKDAAPTYSDGKKNLININLSEFSSVHPIKWALIHELGHLSEYNSIGSGENLFSTSHRNIDNLLKIKKFENKIKNPNAVYNEFVHDKLVYILKELFAEHFLCNVLLNNESTEEFHRFKRWRLNLLKEPNYYQKDWYYLPLIFLLKDLNKTKCCFGTEKFDNYFHQIIFDMILTTPKEWQPKYTKEIDHMLASYG